MQKVYPFSRAKRAHVLEKETLVFSHKKNKKILFIASLTIFILLSLAVGMYGLVWYGRERLQQFKTTAAQYLQLSLADDPKATDTLQSLLTQAHQLLPVLEFGQKIGTTWPVNNLISPSTQTELTQLTSLVKDALPLIPKVLGLSQSSKENEPPVPTRRYILIFQNSEELRATGGFMGSYAILELTNGRVSDLSVQDIYEPDGQFTGFLPAPPGVREYLSSGKGMRLPDTNWSPDVPTSAADIIPFFAFGKTYHIDGLIFINLETAKDLLRLTGNIYLPIYNVTVTPDNVAELARADRDHFFPGSQQKKNFLHSLLKAVKIQISEDLAGGSTGISAQQWQQFLQQQVQKKNMQFFAVDPTVEQLLSKYKVAGEVRGCRDMPDCFSFFAVESNVGINKVNKYVTRTVSLKQGEPDRIVVDIEFSHTGPSVPSPQSSSSHLNSPQLSPTQLTLTPSISLQPPSSPDYVNYQRLLFSPQWQVLDVQVGNQKVTRIDQQLLTLKSGEQLNQVGFLVTVPAGKTQTVRATLVAPQLTLIAPETLKQFRTLIIQKQAGLPPTSYIIDMLGKKKHFILDKDEEL